MDGEWTLVISGIGPHHNKHGGTDANRMAGEFINQLRGAGHIVSHGAFDSEIIGETATDSDDVASTDYIAQRDVIESAIEVTTEVVPEPPAPEVTVNNNEVVTEQPTE